MLYGASFARQTARINQLDLKDQSEERIDVGWIKDTKSDDESLFAIR